MNRKRGNAPQALLIVIVFAAIGLSCEAKTTQLLVVLSSDFSPEELRSVHVAIVREGGGTQEASIRTREEGGAIRPTSFGIAPRAGDPAEEVVTIEITGRSELGGGGCDLARWQGRSSFVPNRIMRLRATLDRRCAGEPGCDAGDLSGSLEEVVPGRELDGVEVTVSDGGGPASCGMDAGAGRDAGADAGRDAGTIEVDAGPVETGLPILGLAAGEAHTCVWVQDAGEDQVWCWGTNGGWQVDPSVSSPNRIPSPSRVILPPEHQDLVGIGLGGSHSCVLTTSRRLVCWGNNGSRQILGGSIADALVPPSEVASGVQTYGLGAANTCWASTGSSTVICRGEAGFCQSGRCGRCPSGTTNCYDGDLGSIGHPSGVERVSAGIVHTCAVLMDGRVFCWGSGCAYDPENAACGNDPISRQIMGLLGATALDVGAYHGCAIASGDSLFCWGRNFSGQLGRDTGGVASSTPTAVPLPGPVLQVSASTSHTCARVDVDGGQVYCWGGNRYGQIGNGSMGADVLTPVRVSLPELPVVLEVATGNNHTCARSERQVYCWGNGSLGELGDGSLEVGRMEPSPVPVSHVWN